MAKPPVRLFRPAAYLRPGDTGEAVAMLRRAVGKAMVIAGGTDVLVKRDPAVAALVDIEALGLRYLRLEAGQTRIGAATTLAALAESGMLTTPALIALKEAAAMMATPQIRNVATIGGNLCTASPAADLALPLLALDASVKALGPKGPIDIAIGEFFAATRKTVLRPDELMLEIVVPSPGDKSGAAFLRLARSTTDIALANVAVRVDFTASGVVADARIALGAVAPTPMRAVEAEQALRGERITADAVSSAARSAAEAARPITDHRTTAAYRRAGVLILVERALLLAARRAEVTPAT